MKTKPLLWLLIFLTAVLLLRPPQEKTVYVIVQTTESGEVRYIETEEMPTEMEYESDDGTTSIVVIIVIVILLFIFGGSDNTA